MSSIPKEVTILRAKLSLVGPSAVGKTALREMFHSNFTRFPRTYNFTVGGEFCVKSVRIPDTDFTVELYIHDLSGSDLYEEMAKDLFQGSSLYAVVYDISGGNEALQEAEKWISKAKRWASAEGKEPMAAVLIGNKSDLEDRLDQARHRGEEFARSRGLEHFTTTCAKGAEGDVDLPFNFMAHQVHKTYINKKLMLSDM